MKKQILSLLLALVMLVSLAACSKPAAPAAEQTTAPAAEQTTTQNEPQKEDTKQETPQETPTEPETVDPASVHFTVMLESSLEDASEMPICKVLEETTGYAPEYLEVSPAAAAEQKELLWMEPTLPDVVMFGLDNPLVNRLANEGLIVDLAPYMTEEIMPNMHKYLQDYEWDAITDAQGHIYFFPSFEDAYINRGLAINMEWLDKLGLDVPETPDELLEVWRAFKTQDPNGNGVADEIPFSSEMGSAGTVAYMDAMFGMFGNVGGWQVDDDGNVFFGHATDACKEGIKWFREAYAEGLLDPEFFTQDLTSFKAKAQNDPLIFGTVFGFVYSANNRCFTWEDAEKYDSLLPMKGPDGIRRWTNPSAYPCSIQYKAVVTSACENVEAICRWVDYMYDPVLGAQLDQAPLGIGVRDNGDGTYTYGDYACPDADLGGYDTYADWRTAMHTQAFPRTNTDYAEDLANFRVFIGDSPLETVYYERNYLYRENCKLSNYMRLDTPTEEETETVNAYLSEFNSYYRSTIASWITGNGDVDAEWDTYLETLNAMGMQELKDAYQARYDRTLG